MNTIRHTFQPYDYTYNMQNTCKIVNVFFPENCTNNCSFCTTKEWYKNIDKNKWWDNLDKILCGFPEIIIITGGEPLINHEELYKIVTYIRTFDPGNSRLKLYLNTSWIDSMVDNDIIKFINYNFDGINISRHQPGRIKLFNKIKVPIRINCIITPKFAPQKYIDYYIDKKVELVFREDYRNITRENLFNFDSPVLKYLTSHYELVSHQYCHFCCNFNFITQKELKIRYHRGINTTSTKIGTITEHMELILAPNGEIYTDWNKTKKGLKELINSI